MSLRYALLAILRVGPLSGYDLQKQFSQSVGLVWHAPDSQIYPELRKMEAGGLIEGEEQTRGARGRRRVYHVTAEGDRTYRAWMAAPLEYQRVRDPAHLRAAYLENTTPDAARAFLHGHIDFWASELEQFEAELDRIEHVSNPMLMRRIEITPPEDRERTLAYKRFTYEGLAERARGEVAWARRGLGLVDRLEGADGAAGSARCGRVPPAARPAPGAARATASRDAG